MIFNNVRINITKLNKKIIIGDIIIRKNKKILRLCKLSKITR